MLWIFMVVLEEMLVELCDVIVWGWVSGMFSFSRLIQVWVYCLVLVQVWLELMIGFYWDSLFDEWLCELVCLKIVSIIICQVC